MARKHHIPVGVDAVNAKLTDEDVIDIRTCYVPRHQYLGGQALAWRYGVSRNTIHKAVTGQTWRHVTPSAAPSVMRGVVD
jgi:hypothetical protein